MKIKSNIKYVIGSRSETFIARIIVSADPQDAFLQFLDETEKLNYILISDIISIIPTTIDGKRFFAIKAKLED